jgi:hypothetical protein
LIEAAESMFITVLVDMAGTNPDDDLIIARYHDNRHNDTVVRIVNGKGNDLAIRLEGKCCSVGNIARAMRGALERKELQVPNYLKFLEAEYLARVDVPCQASRGAKEIVFKTEATTKAEIDFAELNGVIDVECGYLCGSRAVKVTYNSEVIDCKSLLFHAIFHMDVETVYWTNWFEIMAVQSDLDMMDAKPKLVELGSNRFTRGKDPKNFLRTTLLRYVPLTSLQALQANLAISKNHRELALNMLSPRQLAILEAVERKIPRRETVNVGIADAWNRLARDGVFDWN